MIIEVPVFWAGDLNYIWVALASSVAALSAHLLFTRKEIYKLMLYVDGFGAALFAILAVDKVWNLGFGYPGLWCRNWCGHGSLPEHTSVETKTSLT